MTPSTKNFSLATDPMLACSCGHPLCDRRHVRQWVLDNVQAMRDDLGRAIIITSGGRCPYHPDEAGRTDTDHQLRCTVDVACDSALDETRLKVLAGRHGATRVAGTWRDGFLHLSWTPTQRRDVPTWRYKRTD